jgi:tRNA-specific 2-thiouridylase
MSGGVDSSVAAALLRDDDWDVVGATMKLWGGESDTGCCSVADVDDARRVAQQLGIDHHVFNFTADFDERVVAPYVRAHADGRTPNPCVECNRHLKFDRFLRRASQLGFDAIATGHHARVVTGPDDRPQLRRGADPAKDQSYVLSMLGGEQLARCRFPVGALTKADVRVRAAALGLRTADKPDSQDVCFITAAGRAAFLVPRMALHPGRVVEIGTDRVIGSVDAVELVTVGQRRGLGSGAEAPRYAVATDPRAGTVTVGTEADLLVWRVDLDRLTWTGDGLAPGTAVDAQCSAHAPALPAVYEDGGITFVTPERRVAPGQTVALYAGDVVLGGGVAGRAI